MQRDRSQTRTRLPVPSFFESIIFSEVTNNRKLLSSARNSLCSRFIKNPNFSERWNAIYRVRTKSIHLVGLHIYYNTCILCTNLRSRISVYLHHSCYKYVDNAANILTLNKHWSWLHLWENFIQRNCFSHQHVLAFWIKYYLAQFVLNMWFCVLLIKC